MGKKIIFYAPVGKGVESSRIGGAERGALRTLEVLKENEYEIYQVDKPYIENGKVLFLVSIIKAINKIKKFAKNNPDALVYVVGFYEKNTLFENIIISYAKRYGNKSIYEIKNGRFVKTYKEGGEKYKASIDSILSSADIIFCQGSSYVDFINNKNPQKAVYVPNYVLDRFRAILPTNRTFESLKIIYFGRVTSTKGIDVALRTVSELVKNDFPVHMTIIGGYTKEYKEELDCLVRLLGISENVVFTGPKPFEEIREYLQSAHYFIFPSSEPDEGHSNSLTEAMAFGVVPVTSYAGFNQDIVCDEQLIVNTLNPVDYANQIQLIETENLWESKSNKMKERVSGYYSESIVKKTILESIEKLFGKDND